MDEQAAIAPTARAWLVLRSGPLAGTRYALSDGTTRVGRDVTNDVVIRGPEAATVSLQHLEITREPFAWFQARSMRGIFDSHSKYNINSIIQEIKSSCSVPIRDRERGRFHRTNVNHNVYNSLEAATLHGLWRRHPPCRARGAFPVPWLRG